jgi:hypothetical protein
MTQKDKAWHGAWLGHDRRARTGTGVSCPRHPQCDLPLRPGALLNLGETTNMRSINRTCTAAAAAPAARCCCCRRCHCRVQSCLMPHAPLSGFLFSPLSSVGSRGVGRVWLRSRRAGGVVWVGSGQPGGRSRRWACGHRPLLSRPQPSPVVVVSVALVCFGVWLGVHSCTSLAQGCQRSMWMLPEGRRMGPGQGGKQGGGWGAGEARGGSAGASTALGTHRRKRLGRHVSEQRARKAFAAAHLITRPDTPQDQPARFRV